MANANVSESQVINKDKSQAKGGRPRVKPVKATAFQKEESKDRPHEVIEETDAHTITQLRSGTTKIVRH